MALRIPRDLVPGVAPCFHCGKARAPSMCSRCKVTCYCDRACQRKAWRGGHRNVCETYAARGIAKHELPAFEAAQALIGMRMYTETTQERAAFNAFVAAHRAFLNERSRLRPYLFNMVVYDLHLLANRGPPSSDAAADFARFYREKHLRYIKFTARWAAEHEKEEDNGAARMDYGEMLWWLMSDAERSEYDPTTTARERKRHLDADSVESDSPTAKKQRRDVTDPEERIAVDNDISVVLPPIVDDSSDSDSDTVELPARLALPPRQRTYTQHMDRDEIGNERWRAAAFQIPERSKIHRGGEDVFLISNDARLLAVFDGVGYYGEVARDFADGVAIGCHEAYKREKTALTDELLRSGHEYVTQRAMDGSCTAVMARLDEANKRLDVINLGDSVFYHWRPRTGELTRITTCQQTAFNRPRQLSIRAPQELEHIEQVQVPLQPGDVAILASDALPDNVEDDELEDMLTTVVTQRPAAYASAIARFVEHCINKNKDSPFYREARSRAVYKHTYGTKPDDITIVVMCYRG